MDITFERFKMDLISKILALPRQERQSFICDGVNTALRDELVPLLDVDDDSGFAPFLSDMIEDIRVGDPFMPPDIGQELGPWKLESLMDEGGMNWVYLATREGGRHQVALKVSKNRPAYRDCLAKEWSILRGLNHPGIVSALDYGASESYAYMALRYHRGQRLDEWIKTRPSQRRKVALFCRVCDVLEYVHSYGFVHRDLKPGNILIDDQDRPCLLDFGAARDRCNQWRQTGWTDQIFSPNYAAPEQVEGALSIPETDTYALGMLLYFMLTGKSLRKERLKVSKGWTSLLNIYKKPVNRVRDSHLNGVIRTAICEDVEARYASPAILKRAVEVWLDKDEKP